MLNRQLLLLALALWAACAGAAPLPRIATFPSAAQVYTSEEPGGGLAVLAPNAAVLKAGAAPVGPLLTGLATPEDCAAACRAATSCSWFDFCQTPDGCPQGAQVLAYGDCRLYAQRTCSQPLQLNATKGLLAGFPVLLPEVLVTGFSLVAGQGIAGGDHGCPGSLLPGKCAVRSTEEALLLCLATPACRAVTVLLNGTDGCSSEPVSLLKLEGLSPHNSYVASGVVTLQPPEVRETVNSQLTEAEGQVLLPTAAELAALPATNASLTNDSAWRGCVLGNGTLMAGRPVATLERVDSAEACCRECRAQYAIPNGCNVWNYCPVPGGCSYQGQLMTSNASLGYQQCALLYQELVTPSFGLPPALLAHGPDVPFVGGAPLVVGAEAVLEGYQQLVGRGAVPFGASACDVEQGVVDAVLCVLNVTSVEAMGAWCQDVGACSAFVPWRDSGYANWPQQGVFRRDTSASSRLLMPTQTLYVRDLQPEPQPADGGGDPLSSGAVAGIAVGAAAAGACVAAAIFCVLRKRRRLAAESGKEAEDLEELGGMQASGELDSGTLDTRKDSCGNSLLNCPLGDGSAESQQLPLQQQAQQQQQQPLNLPTRVGLPSTVAVRPTRHDTAAQRVQQQQQQQQQRGVQMTAPAAPHPARAQFATQSVDEDLLSPFAAASVGYGSGTGSPGRAAQQDAPPGGHADGLGQLRAYRLGSPGIAAGGRAGSVPPQSSGRQQWRPPLPPSRSNSGPCSGLPSAAVAAAMARGMDAAAALLAQGSTASTAQSPLQAQASDPRTLTPQGSDSDSARGSGQTAAAAAAGSPGSGIGYASSSSMALLRNQRTGSGALPELAQFVAAQEAAAASGIGGMDETSTHLQLLNEANLPHRLREWVIHPSQVTYQRWANGKLWELGSGASGHVFKATYNGEAVAAKEMEIGQSPAGQEAFLNEALRLQALRHPHVVGFYGVILTGSKGVVLMEYCEGRDLHSALGVTAAGGTHRLFSWHRRGRRVALELVKAINYLHSKGIVHMDIKSSNVLLTSGGTAKLADVAFSRELAGEILPDVPFTGTFPWIAPEVLCGRECTQSVDIFSFGVVLWEIVTGEEPKRGCMRMPQVPEECPQDVCDLMMECLDEVPSVRPTAHQLLQRINQMMERANARGSAARSRASLDRGPASGAPSRMGSQDVASPGLRSEASSELAGARSSRRSMDVLAVRGLSPIPSPTTSPRGR